ncbi:hypothetical protein KAH81_01650 [bacterium]|nr:hypothetical protein [bacterium]
MIKINFKRLALFGIISSLVLAAFLLMLVAFRIASLNGEGFTFVSVIKSFDLLYEIIFLPYSNAIHSILALLLGIAVFSFYKTGKENQK